MLRCESRRQYIVYPSWAEGQLPCPWKDVPTVLADPEHSQFFDDNDRMYLWNNPGAYPRPIQPFRCLDGPCGGGLIEVDVAQGEHWLPDLAIRHIADILTPPGMDYPHGLPRPCVSYLEPIDDEGLRLVSSLIGGRYTGPKLYLCHTTVEYADSAGEHVYVVTMHRPSGQPLSGLAELPRCVRPFGLTLSPLRAPSTALRDEVHAWFVHDPDLVKTWFTLSGGEGRLGYLFAVTLYAGLHLRQVAGKQLFSVHLVAAIEGKPNYIRHWWRKCD